MMRLTVQYSTWKTMELATWLIVCLSVVPAILLLWRLLSRSLWVLTAGGARTGDSPFRHVFSPTPPARVVSAAKERDRVLKQSFSVDKIPDKLDAIIIGEPISRARNG